MSARHSAPDILRLWPSIWVSLSFSTRRSLQSESLRRVVTRHGVVRLAADEPSHRGIGAAPGANGCERHIDGILCIADDRESGQQVPDRAPISGADAPSCANCRVEEHIGGVGYGG